MVIDVKHLTKGISTQRECEKEDVVNENTGIVLVKRREYIELDIWSK